MASILERWIEHVQLALISTWSSSALLCCSQPVCVFNQSKHVMYFETFVQFDVLSNWVVWLLFSVCMCSVSFQMGNKDYCSVLFVMTLDSCTVALVKFLRIVGVSSRSSLESVWSLFCYVSSPTDSSPTCWQLSNQVLSAEEAQPPKPFWSVGTGAQEIVKSHTCKYSHWHFFNNVVEITTAVLVLLLYLY